MEDSTVTTMLTPDVTADSSSAPDADASSDQLAQTGDPGAPFAPETPKEQGAGPSGAERRIQQLVARQREAERREAARAGEAAYWRGIAEGRIRPAAPVQPQSPAGGPEFPTLADFERSEDFEEARTRYVVEKAKWDLKQELEAHRVRETQGEIERRYRARMAAAAESDPELPEIENDATLPVSLPMALAIKESESAPQVLRYLSAHRDEAARISRMNPIAAVREIGKIEAAEGPRSRPQDLRTVSQAPEPVRPVGGTKGSIDTDDERVPIGEFVRRRNEAQYGRRK
jgi:hypothetical protein